MIEITLESLAQLRQSVSERMSPKRFAHTLAVEEMVAELCSLYCPQSTGVMRVAALLHDLTKELDTKEQVALCGRLGLEVSSEELAAPKTFHARTAAELIKHEFSAYAYPEVINAVRWHTTGHADMTLTERLLYLADYIDLSRSFHSCVLLRRYFWGAEPQKMDAHSKMQLLYQTLLLSFDMTIRELLDEGKPVARDTVNARNEVLSLLNA